MRIAKNTLLRVAIEGDEKWQVVGSQLEASNMWFFVGSDLKGTFEGFEKFIKENKDLKDSHSYRFGAIDGALLDAAGVEKVGLCCGKGREAGLYGCGWMAGWRAG